MESFGAALRQKDFEMEGTSDRVEVCIHPAVAGHHLMLVLYGRFTFQPACVFRGLNKGLNCVRWRARTTNITLC